MKLKKILLASTFLFSSLAICVPVHAGEWKAGAKGIYYMENGQKATGWKEINGKKYYFGTDGVMKKRWVTIGSDKYYFGTNGVMRTGYQYITGQRYFFEDNGMLRTEGEVTYRDIRWTIMASTGRLTNLPKQRYSTFIEMANGKSFDVDGNSVQCVDLAKVYLNYVFGLAMVSRGDAWKYYADFDNWGDLTYNFTRVPYTQGFVVEQGDIVVWNNSVGDGAGHIAIGAGGTSSSFQSYDQNWGSPNQGTTLTTHNYSNVLGVLRPKDKAKTK